MTISRARQISGSKPNRHNTIWPEISVVGNSCLASPRLAVTAGFIDHVCTVAVDLGLIWFNFSQLVLARPRRRLFRLVLNFNLNLNLNL